MIYFALLLFCLLCLYLYALFPRLSKKKQLDAYKKVYYAHRGLHNEEFPENTLGAFERAKNYGFGIELDVQLTKDEIPVICHDFNLKRACGIDKEIDECTYEELTHYPLFNSSYTIPKLEEALKLIDHQVPIIVEIKQKGIDCQTCVQAAKLLDNYKSDYIVESFNPMAMNWYLKNRPEIIRGQLSSDFSDDKKMNKIMGFLLKHLCGNFLSRPDFIAYDIVFQEEFSFRLLKKFICSVGWTCKDKNTFNEIKNDYDIIIFENFIPK